MWDKIDFNAALEDCKRVRDGIKSDEDFQNADSGLVMYYLNTIIQALEIATTMKRGKWSEYSRNALETYIECTNCCIASRPIHLQMVTKNGSGLPEYCPNCGARMEVDEDGTRD